jgi:hypothetical protein
MPKISELYPSSERGGKRDQHEWKETSPSRTPGTDAEGGSKSTPRTKPPLFACRPHPNNLLRCQSMICREDNPSSPRLAGSNQLWSAWANHDSAVSAQRCTDQHDYSVEAVRRWDALSFQASPSPNLLSFGEESTIMKSSLLFREVFPKTTFA